MILDEVSEACFLKRHREALQSAKSATNAYASTHSFCGQAVVATLDLLAKNVNDFGSAWAVPCTWCTVEKRNLGRNHVEHFF